MNKAELKNFAILSRRQLIDQVKTKALMYGIDEKNDLEIQEQFGQLMINEKQYPLHMKSAFNSLKNQLRQKGYKQLVDEVAYTWFNRIIAIRYMEVHDYLPEKVNVLSSSVGRVDPDILFEYETMDLPIKQEEIRELLDAGDTEGAYRELFIAQCNTLNSILPFLFEQIQDYTELLLPDFLLDAESVIKVLVQNDELTNSFDEIEMIGWLYQYYIAEEKDRVFAQKSKYKKEEIPFATQLFTPKWIVQYMVQNSLGRYWTEAHREDEDLINNWEYFIKHEEEDFHEKIAPYVNKELRVEDIKLLDPAMGSGHILVYAFEVFYQIYEKCGYPERDIPRLIIENNLYGLDIDDRAYQLATFAVVMKAVSYSRRFLRSIEREGVQLNLASIQETNHISDSTIAYIAQEEEGERYNQVKAFFDQFHNAKTYGSLINITERDLSFIEERCENIQNNPVENLFFTEQHDIVKEVMPALIQQTKIMRNKYEVVVMNPPYMGSSKMGKELNDFVKKNYPNSKDDLFANFMEKNDYIKAGGFYSAINQHAWMFLSKFKKLRKSFLESLVIDSLLHLGARAFDEISGEVVQSVAFVSRKKIIGISTYDSIFFNLREQSNSMKKQEEFVSLLKKNPSGDKKFVLKQQIFLKVPSYNIVYWADNYEVFGGEKIGDYFISGGRNKTHGNSKYVRMFWEIESEKWESYQNGGHDSRFYGNDVYVVDWSVEAKEFYKQHGGLINAKFIGREGITWSLVTSTTPSFRSKESHSVYSSGSPTIFPIEGDKEELLFILGYLNSTTAQYILNMLNPTLNLPVGDVLSVPYPIVEYKEKKEVIKITEQMIEVYKELWNYDEFSKGFTEHPIISISKDSVISNRYSKFQEKINSLNELIIKNQKILDDIFSEGLNIMTPNYNYQQLIYTLSEKELCESLISYFIGIALGRYSLEGLNIANSNKGFLLLTDKEYFENDIFELFKGFIRFIFGNETLEENIAWIATSIKGESLLRSEDIIRKYFIDNFFEKHCKKYQNSSKQKLPIYWLVDSGKCKGLRTLMYMHRYQPDTMATIRFEHLQEIQAKYQNEINDLENRLMNPTLSASEKKKLISEKTSFEKKLDELREFDKRLAEIANEEIEIDLDDGVKVNYEKFYRGGKGVLAKIK
ncbi:BREX-1 system adenine-specific DNA-methyltransferase PglX [Niallia taxi]|uniref:BREX-1 system adenine-specific DNA-methyltransferase PglX n=1 Tax=Niallia taxi TaxID=2499688 RepID=UPI003981F8AF